jgi:hypothetical protein
MTTIYDQCVKLLQERGMITYEQAARELQCDMSTVGKAYRRVEAAGEAMIDKSVFPYIVRRKIAIERT